MKKLVKASTPSVLVSNGAKWTDDYVQAVRSGDKKRKSNAEKWRHPGIKTALSEETKKKCAYCESEIDHVAWPHVEHITPKNRAPELAHDWSNLTNACEKCNVAKDDYYDDSGDFALINPYVDDPKSHIVFYGPLALAPPTSKRGPFTIKHLKLNRSDLFLRRAERLEHLAQAILDWQTTENAAARGALHKYIEDMIEEGEYSSAARKLFEDYGASEGV